MSEEITQSVRFLPETLLRMNDDLLDRIGKVFADGLKRKRNVLLCQRDGHPESDSLATAGICGRCFVVVDEAKYAHIQE